MLDSDKYLIYNTSMKYERRNKENDKRKIIQETFILSQQFYTMTVMEYMQV